MYKWTWLQASTGNLIEINRIAQSLDISFKVRQPKSADSKVAVCMTVLTQDILEISINEKS